MKIDLDLLWHVHMTEDSASYNVANALLSYYESLPECMHEPRDEDFGWSVWALHRLEELTERIEQTCRK